MVSALEKLRCKQSTEGQEQSCRVFGKHREKSSLILTLWGEVRLNCNMKGILDLFRTQLSHEG